VGLPDTSTIQATHTCTLNLPNLPTAAQSAHIFPKMQAALLSIPKLCDSGCTARLSATDIIVTDRKGTVIIIGTRDPSTKLWHVPLQSPNDTPSKPVQISNQNNRMDFANSAYKQKTMEDLITFLHAAAGSPTVATWGTAIDKGFFNTWPGLTSTLLRKHLPKSIATVMGHLHMQRQGVRSTRTPKPTTNDYDKTLPLPRSHLDRNHNVGAHLFEIENNLKGMISSDLTGRFPYTSSRGMTYLFILYDYDSNAILASPIKSRSAEDIVVGYKFCHQQLSAAGISPILQRLDNEASTALIHAITTKNLQYQLASPHSHRLNPAERAIQTLKNHFISCLNGTNTRFSPHLWCRPIPQVVMTLNMLRTSRINPKLSAYS
jgi:hypothetical protein